VLAVPISHAVNKSSQYILTALLAPIIVGFVILTEGDIYAALTIASIIGGLWLTFRYEQYSFYLMVFLVLVLEQFPVQRPFDNTITVILGRYYLGNLYQVIPFAFLKMNTLEIHIGALVMVLLFKHKFEPTDRYPKLAILPLALAFLGIVLLGEARGMTSGGDLLKSLWEIRALVYLVAIVLIAPRMIRSEKEVRILIWVVIAALGLKAFQGFYYFMFTLGAKLGATQTILAHEDSHFFNFAFIVLLGMILFKFKDSQRTVLLLLLPIMGFLFLVNQRRVTYGTLLLGILIALIVVDNPAVKRRALGFAAAAMLLAVPYTAIFWNSSSAIALPIRQAKSVFDEKDGSNLYRVNEKVNLAYSITSSPFGEGFGKKYKVIVPMDDISKLFPLWDFIPHNSVLGFWTKAGTHGFIIFLFFFGGALAHATNSFRKLRDPYHKILALAVMTQIVGQLIVSYYDLQLNYYRNMVFLGMQLGLIAALRNLEEPVLAKVPASIDELSAEVEHDRDDDFAGDAQYV
jgi:O-antigen ligase